MGSRRVAPSPSAVLDLAQFDEPLPEAPGDAFCVLDLLDRLGSPATVANAGGRFFGFVNGGALPVSVAATWIASAWDQNAALRVMSPAAAALEDVALGWVRDAVGASLGMRRIGCDRRQHGELLQALPRPVTRCWSGAVGTWRTTACSERRR